MVQSQMVTIQVGTVKHPFQIHLSLLKNTSFFDVHGYPEEQPETVVDDDDDDVEVKDEIQTNGQVASPTNSDFTIRNQDVIRYDLKDRSTHSFEAFAIFVNWLYQQDPVPIKHRADCKILMKAYSVARRYKALSLQNKLLECFCTHHKTTTVNFDDFIYMTNRMGDEADTTPLVAYMAYQVAFEVAGGGLSKYLADNGFLKTFLVEGDRKVRFLLFEALASYADQANYGDPAENPKRWFVAAGRP